MKWAWNIPSMPERVSTKKANKEKILSSSSLSEHYFPSIFLLCSTLRQKGRQGQNQFNLVHEREGSPEMGKKAHKGKGLGEKMGAYHGFLICALALSCLAYGKKLERTLAG